MSQKTFWKGMSLILGVLLCFSLFVLRQQMDVLQEGNDLCNEYAEKLSGCHNTMLDLLLQVQTQEAELSALRLNEERYKTSLGLMTQPAYVLSREDIILLAKVVQCEAGPSVSVSGNPINTSAQKYITKVILNRVVSPSFPDSVHDVVYQKNQFSVLDQLDSTEVEVGTLLNIYDVLLHNGADDLPVYVCYFYADWVKDQWINTLPVYMTHEGTVYAYDSKEVA